MPQPTKRRSESARRANRTIGQRTLLLLAVFGVLTFVLLFSKLYEWQITRQSELQSIAVRQQTLRTTVGASRGTIYDRNGRTLAISATAENVCISPRQLKKDGVDLDETALLKTDKAATASYFSTLTTNGILTRNEARVALGHAPVDGGDTLQVAFSDIAQNTINNESSSNNNE